MLNRTFATPLTMMSVFPFLVLAGAIVTAIVGTIVGDRFLIFTPLGIGTALVIISNILFSRDQVKGAAFFAVVATFVLAYTVFFPPHSPWNTIFGLRPHVFMGAIALASFMASAAIDREKGFYFMFSALLYVPAAGLFLLLAVLCGMSLFL